MYLKLAWRNIWRNKKRTGITLASVFFAVVLSTLLRFFQWQKNQLVLSHFQIHQPHFTDDLRPKFFMPDGEAIQNKIEQDEQVLGVSGRIVSMMMMSTASQTGFLKLSGIVPEQEIKVTGMNDWMVEGDFLENDGKKSIIISRKQADKFKVKLRSKVVLTFLNVNNEITAGAFRVAGIYKSANVRYDEDNIFVHRDAIQPLLGIDKGFHEIAVLLNGYDLTDTVAAKYQKIFPDLEVKSWMDISSGMRFMLEAFDIYLYIIVGIILVALLFSIINTMLMAVLERVREIGMLLAIGMTKPKVFMMIMIETTYISIIGGFIGLMLSWAFIVYFGNHGINLSAAAYGEMGFATVIYPYLELRNYISISAMIFFMALLAAVFPARRALKLVPADVIRKI